MALRRARTGSATAPKGRLDTLDDLDVSDNVRDVLETVDLISTPAGALGAYVISQATKASDVSVELLQQEAGCKNRLRIVPLFETLDDLQNASQTLQTLFASKGYAKRTGSRQEVMVGYSDSAKDAGRIAATWAQYMRRRNMKVADKHGFDLPFSTARVALLGGNPALYRGILDGHPPGTIGGNFRITEQGEMITHNFGIPGIASGRQT